MPRLPQPPQLELSGQWDVASGPGPTSVVSVRADCPAVLRDKLGASSPTDKCCGVASRDLSVWRNRTGWVGIGEKEIRGKEREGDGKGDGSRAKERE